MVALQRVARNQPLSESLRGVHLGVAGGGTVADSMRASTTEMLASIDLYGCNLTDAGVEPLALMLCERGGSESLDLGANAIRHAASLLSPLLVQRAAKADDDDSFGCGGLHELRLARNGIAGEAVHALLSPPSVGKLSLQSLALAFNPLGAGGGAAIGRVFTAGQLPLLACLQLQGCELGAAGVTELVRGLEHAAALTHLDLSDNAAGDVGACALAAALPHTVVEELLLSRNALGDQAGQALAAALVRKRKCAVRTLVLASNQLRDASAVAFGEALGAPKPGGNRSLETLDLSANKLRAHAVLALGDALVANGKLTALDLSRNKHIDTEALQAMAGLLRLNRRAAAGDAAPAESVAPSAHARQLADRDVLKLFTSEGLRPQPNSLMPPPPHLHLPPAPAPSRANAFGPTRAPAEYPAAIPSAESLTAHALVRQADAAAGASTALREVQAALDDAGMEVARLRHKEATLMRALREANAL